VTGRYETFAPRLVDNNWDVTPVNGKRAILSGWASRPATALEYHNHSNASIGVLTGGQFNIVAVDVDILNQIASDALHKLAEECLGFAPRRIGRAPKFLLLYRCSEAVRKTKTGVYTIDDDSAAVEILAEGQQFVAAGVHPDTKQKYEWPGDSILDLTPDDLTIVTPEQLDTFLGSAASVLSQYGDLKGRVSGRTAVPATTGGLSFQELAGEAGEVKAALALLPNNDEHYDDWISTLHALKGALGNDAGRDLAHCWSRRSDKYDESETDRAWNSITQVRHIGAGSIFHWASAHGFDLKALRTPQHEGPKDVAREEEFDPLAGIMRASDIRGPVPQRNWMLDQWFPARAVSLLFGPGGVGKTLLVQQLANCVATGQPFMGIATHKMPVLAVMCEDDALEISRRQLSINEWLGINEITGTGPQELFIWPRVGEDNILVTYPSQGEGQPGAFYGLLKQGVERVQQQSEDILVVLDTAADMYGGNENVRREVNTFIKTYLGSFCVNHNATVLVLAHPSVAGENTGTGLSGSTAWENAARARAYFHRSDDGDDIRILSRKKSNYSASGDSHDVTLLWDKGVYQLPAEPDQVDRIEQRALKNKVISEVQSAFMKGAGYRKQGPRSYKTALAPIVKDAPARVAKVVNQMYADAVLGYDDKRGFFEL
jgi:hypothetical protein